MKTKSIVKDIKSMRELDLVINNLKNHEVICEKNMVSSSAKVVDNLTDKIHDLAFDLGIAAITQIISIFRKRK